MEKYLKSKDAAELIPGMTVSGLANLRYSGKGPKYLNPPGTRVILYRESDVIEWLEASERTGTVLA